MNRRELIIGVVVVVVLISLGIAKIVRRPPSPEGEGQQISTQSIDPVVPQDDDRMTLEEQLAAAKREKALAAINEHEIAMASNWDAADIPDRYMAVGNLYQYQLEEYQSAIQNYSSLIDKYPEHRQVPQAYIEIAAAYERMGNEGQARYVYEEMLDKLDPSSQHVAYAKKRLGEM